MREKTCCFTGHRFLPEQDKPKIRQVLEQETIKLIEKGVIFYGVGGALGFDTLAAQVVLALRERYPFIRLILVLPCVTQTRGWQTTDIEVYEDIKRQADKVVYVSTDYNKSCMFKRNRHLIDNSAYCQCYLTKKTGGTAYTVRYATEKQVKIIRIAELI